MVNVNLVWENAGASWIYQVEMVKLGGNKRKKVYWPAVYKMGDPTSEEQPVQPERAGDSGNMGAAPGTPKAAED